MFCAQHKLLHIFANKLHNYCRLLYNVVIILTLTSLKIQDKIRKHLIFYIAFVWDMVLYELNSAHAAIFLRILGANQRHNCRSSTHLSISPLLYGRFRLRSQNTWFFAFLLCDGWYFVCLTHTFSHNILSFHIFSLLINNWHWSYCRSRLRSGKWLYVVNRQQCWVLKLSSVDLLCLLWYNHVYPPLF